MTIDPAISWDAKSELAPILRHPRSFCPNNSVLGVHDYFSLNAQAHNSLYSGLHQQFKLGVPRQQKPIKLAPIDRPVAPGTSVRLRFLGISPDAKDETPTSGALGDGIPKLLQMQHRPQGDPPNGSSSTQLQKIADGMQTLNVQIEEGGGSRALERMVDEMEKAAAAKAEQFKTLKLKAKEGLLAAHRNGDLEIIASAMEAAEEAMLKKKRDLRALKARAGKSLLDAHRTGDLERIFNDLELTTKEAEAAIKRSDYMSDIKGRAKRGMLEAKRAGTLDNLIRGLDDAREELWEKGEELKALKKKVKAGLLHAYRCGDLEKIAENMEKEAKRKAVEFRALKAKAAKGLLEAKRNGQLERMTADLAKAEQDMLETADKLKAMREGGEQISARQLENMAESMFKAGDAALTKAQEFQLVRDKAKRALLQANRDGHLEALAAKMEDRADRMAVIKTKCDKVLQETLKSGDFEKLAQSLEQSLREELATLKVEQHAARVKGDDRADASLEVQEKSLLAKTARMAELKKKCQRGELDPEDIKELERGISELNDDFEVSAQKFSATRKKAREQLLAAKRNGQLEKIARKMEDAKQAIEEKDYQFARKKDELLVLKKKARMGIIEAKESGLLLQLAKEMEETATEIMKKEMLVSDLNAEAKCLSAKAISDKKAQDEREARINLEELSVIKAKAKKGIIDASRSGKLQLLADEMETEAKAEHMAEIKEKAKRGILESKRSGQLEELAGEMEAEAHAVHMAEIKGKAKRGILESKRTGMLEELAGEMEAEAKAKHMAEIKGKAKRGILESKRTGLLDELAEGMEAEAKAKAETEKTADEGDGDTAAQAEQTEEAPAQEG
eukprot:GEMP01005208.1.p1 GENE.GEMP01005208.1~~GEMP01005208.1.p1  ORF type:complete len:849 (+),score=259.77 GEMP01005208.1:57-2603(+)